jgi:hypothetical protein
MATAKKSVKKRVTQKTQKTPKRRILAQNMKAQDFRRFLVNNFACYEAREWLGTRGLRTAWEECPYGVWLGWLAITLQQRRRLKVSNKVLESLRAKHGSIVFHPDRTSNRALLADLRSRFGVR